MAKGKYDGSGKKKDETKPLIFFFQLLIIILSIQIRPQFYDPNATEMFSERQDFERQMEGESLLLAKKSRNSFGIWLGSYLRAQVGLAHDFFYKFSQWVGLVQFIEVYVRLYHANGLCEMKLSMGNTRIRITHRYLTRNKI